MALSKEQRQLIEKEFDRMITEAREGFTMKKPDMSAVDAQTYAAETRKYNEALALFNENPLLGKVQAIKDEVAEQRKAGAGEDKLKELEQLRIQELKQKITKGVDADLVNVESRKEAQQQLMSSLWPPNFVGIATSLYRMLSGGNEWINAANDTVSEALSGNVSDPQKAFMLAKEGSFLTSGMASGLLGAGISVDENKQEYIAQKVAAFVAPAPEKKDVPAPEGEKKPEVFSAPNGSVPPPPALAAPVPQSNPLMTTQR